MPIFAVHAMPIQKERLLQQLKVHRKGQNIKLAIEYK